jgi:hypothetical protein
LPRADRGTIQEQEKAAEEEAAREHDIALGNPLLNPKTDFNVKRRYVCYTISATYLVSDSSIDGMTM